MNPALKNACTGPCNLPPPGLKPANNESPIRVTSTFHLNSLIGLGFDFTWPYLFPISDSTPWSIANQLEWFYAH